MAYRYRSRLEKTESKRFARQALLLGIATLVLLVILIIIGIPALTKLAVYFSGGKASGGTEPEDVVAPFSPQINTPPEATSSATVSLSGYAEAGSEVVLTSDDVTIQKTIVDASGSFVLSNIQLQQGTNSFSLTSIDQAGNESAPTPLIHIDFDDEKPKLTISEPNDEQKFFGSGERLITITGVTDQDAQITFNNRSLVVDSSGSFTTSHELQEGESQLEIVATDKAGNSTTSIVKVSYQP
jgi:bacillopeptidase F